MKYRKGSANKTVEDNGCSAFADCMFSHFLRVFVPFGAALTAAVPHLIVRQRKNMDIRAKTLLIFSLGGNALLIAVVLFGVATWPRGDMKYSAVSPVSQSPSERAVETEGSTFTSNIASEQPSAAKPLGDQNDEPSNFRDLLGELEAMDLRIVPRRLFDQVEIPALDSYGQVTGQIRDLLALDEQEEENLNLAINRVAERLRHVELENMQVDLISERSARVRIQPAEFGEQIREDLRIAVHQELGDVDGALLWDIMNDKKNSEFWSGFAGQGSEIDVEMIPSDDGTIAFTVERRSIHRHGSTPTHEYIMYPTEPEDAAERMGTFLGRQNYIIEYLPEELRTLLPQSQ